MAEVINSNCIIYERKKSVCYKLISLNYIKIIITTLNSTEVEWEIGRDDLKALFQFKILRFYECVIDLK